MANSNMYSISGDEIGGLFSDYIEGNAAGSVLSLSATPLQKEARSALEKTFAAFQYGASTLTWATLKPFANCTPETPSLDPSALFMLIEGLDPICLVACDKESVAALGRTYRCTLNNDTAQRVFGRPCVLFENLTSMLQTPEGKQGAWTLLKTLPRFDK